MDVEDWNDLCNEVEDHIRGSREAYIGRTRDPDRRQVAHAKRWDCEDLIVLGRSFDRREIEAVEEGLIAAMGRFLRLLNIDTRSSGRYVEGRNYVYVAVR